MELCYITQVFMLDSSLTNNLQFQQRMKQTTRGIEPEEQTENKQMSKRGLNLDSLSSDLI